MPGDALYLALWNCIDRPESLLPVSLTSKQPVVCMVAVLHSKNLIEQPRHFINWGILDQLVIFLTVLTLCAIKCYVALFKLWHSTVCVRLADLFCLQCFTSTLRFRVVCFVCFSVFLP